MPGSVPGKATQNLDGIKSGSLWSLAKLPLDFILVLPDLPDCPVSDAKLHHGTWFHLFVGVVEHRPPSCPASSLNAFGPPPDFLEGAPAFFPSPALARDEPPLGKLRGVVRAGLKVPCLFPFPRRLLCRRCALPAKHTFALLVALGVLHAACAVEVPATLPAPIFCVGGGDLSGSLQRCPAAHVAYSLLPHYKLIQYIMPFMEKPKRKVA